MGTDNTADDGRVPDIKFDSMATSDEVATFFREDLQGKIAGIQQALMLVAFDRSGLVAFLRTLDDDAKMDLVESATGFSNWAKSLVDIAEAAAVRSLIAIGEIAGMLKPMSNDDTDPAAAEWDRYGHAYRDYRQAFDDGQPYDEQHPHGVECDAADLTLAALQSSTLQGVEGKLRRLFMYHNREDWAADLALGTDNLTTRHSLGLADLYDRILWGAIEDLQRLASVGGAG